VADATFDVLVLGGGSAGCVLASRLSEDASRQVCLVEAGPDYGPSAADAWPEELLDGRLPPTSHDWRDEHGTLPVGRVMGGCSALNMCTLMRGAPDDYAGWADVTGDESLTEAGFEPYLQRALDRMTKRRFGEEELDPWFKGLAAASAEIGLPVHADGNEPTATEGLGRLPFNLRGTMRWNAAFEYLDPVRDRPNLSIRSGALVDRVTPAGSRARGVEVQVDGQRQELLADLVVVCGGAYGSPAILLRSGIGPEDALRRLDIAPAAVLPVGEVLREHFGVPVRFAPTDRMADDFAKHRAHSDDPSLQGVLKTRTSTCPEGSCDLHLLAAAFPADDGVSLAMSSMLMQADWTGSVQLRSKDPTELPEVAEFDLAADTDLDRVLEGVSLARRLASSEALNGLVAEELAPGADVTREELRSRGRGGLTNYFHPVATCAMGPISDSSGRIHGFENLHVVDASIIPRPLQSSPHLTVLALAERAAERL
jgi:choline dehydrogenase